MDLTQRQDVAWIHLAQYMVYWWPLVNTEMNTTSGCGMDSSGSVYGVLVASCEHGNEHVRMWHGFIWLSVWCTGGLLWTRKWTRQDVAWIHLAQYMVYWRPLVNTEMNIRINFYMKNSLIWCIFNENHKSITFVRNISCLYCTQTTLHVSAIQPSSGVSHI
jgi:hypothetical protein